MDAKLRGWLYIVGALVAGYCAWYNNLQWSTLILAALFLVSGWHHAMGKHKK